MALDLGLVEQPHQSGWEWPASSPVPLHVRKQIEAAHSAPQQQRRDELAELRSAKALLEQRVAALERALTKFRGAYNRTVTNLGDAIEGLNLLMFGEPETLPKTKDELDGFEPHIIKMIRATARTKEHGERIAALEARPVYKFIGTFVEGSEYEPGNICVRSGGSWICTEKTRDTPGKSLCWAQLSRPGRDGRDARSVVEERRRQRAQPEPPE